MTALKRWRLSRGWKKRNQALLAQLADWNMTLQTPDRIMARLGLTAADRDMLSILAQKPDGPIPFEFGSGSLGDVPRLGALGLARLFWPTNRIGLTDAGRFLLSLTAK